MASTPAWQIGMMPQNIAASSAPSNKDVALELARLGIRIFPCKEDRTPDVQKEWEEAATSDVSKVDGWRTANVPAIPPGIQGLVVVDCDRHRPDEDGVSAFQALCREHSVSLEGAFVVETPRAGLHYYFKVQMPYGNGHLFPAGIDVKGCGGYVIGPGTALPLGYTYDDGTVLENGGKYRIVSGDWSAIPPLPSALAAFLKERRPVAPPETPQAVTGQGPIVNADDLAYFIKPFAAERAKLRALTQGRNVALMQLAKFAGNWMHYGLDRQQIEADLYADSVANGYIAAHGASVARTTIRHNIEDGMTKPCELPSAKRAALTAGMDFSGLYAEQPRPLRRRTVEGHRFPLHALGNTLQWAADAIADKIQCPVGMAAMSVLGAASLVVQSHGDIVLPASGQTKPLSLFLVSIGESGERKSAADGEALRAVRLREKELTEVHDKELASYRNNHDAWEAARARILKGKAEHPLEIAGQLARIGLEPVAPLTPILTCPEPTFEGLCNLYQTGWPGLGLFSDEGGQFVGGHALSVDSRLRTIAGLSTLWDGAAIKRVRAAKDGSYVLPGRRLAMHLMLQPGVAAGLLSDPILKDQGFLSRLLVSHPPSTTGTRLQRPVKQHTQEWLDFYTNRLLTMLQQHPTTVEGKPSELSPRALRFEPAAQEAWTEYADSVEKQIGAGGKYESIMRFANKLPEHASRIAGVLTLFDDLSSPYLTVNAFSRGVEIANHFADEALRLFDAGMVTPEISVAESLLEWLLAKWTEPYIGLSSIYQRGPNAIRDAKAAKAAVSTLVEHGWLLKAPAGTLVGGRAVKEAWQIIRLAN